MTKFSLGYSLMVLSLVALLAAACGPGGVPKDPAGDEGQAPPAAVSPGEEMTGFSGFVDSLKAAGAQVEMGDEIDQSFFDVEGKIVRVNGADVQVFEFANEADRAAASGQISADGTEIGTSIIRWIAPPHFWAHENLIVLYLGEDAAMIELLNGVLGQQITQP